MMETFKPMYIRRTNSNNKHHGPIHQVQPLSTFNVFVFVKRGGQSLTNETMSSIAKMY